RERGARQERLRGRQPHAGERRARAGSRGTRFGVAPRADLGLDGLDGGARADRRGARRAPRHRRAAPKPPEPTAERLETRTNLFRVKLGDTQAVQLRIADAAARIDAAEALALRDIEE